MFGNKDEILEKAERAGIQIEILSWDKVKKEDGIHAHYKIGFKDVDQFLKSDIITSEFQLVKDSNGNWICELKEDREKVQESKVQMEQYK